MKILQASPHFPPRSIGGVEIYVKRLSDKKQFLLPLATLEATQKKSHNYQLLDDYAVWFVNWR